MASNIKVLQVIPRLGYGGAETGCYDIAHYLPENNCESFIVTSGGELLRFVNKQKVKLIRLPVHSKNPLIILFNYKNINFLSASRVFLFGARDVWFVVGLPLFFYSILSDGSVDDNKKAFFIIGSFLAFWIIIYGIIQTLTPKLTKNQISKTSSVQVAKNWSLYLLPIPIILFFKIFFAPFNVNK